MSGHKRTPIEIGLTVAIVAMEKATPLILAAGAAPQGPIGLPSGPFEPLAHRTFEIALRNFVAEQTALAVGYVEQLYTFGDRGRHARAEDADPHVLSVGYLALTRLPDEDAALIAAGPRFEPWYRVFSSGEWGDGRPGNLDYPS